MRPHPLLAITSAIFVVGAAGAIGDAALTAKATNPARVHRRVDAARHNVKPRVLITHLVRNKSAFVIGTHVTTPIPYLFATTPTRRRHLSVTGIGFEVRPTAAATPPQWLALRQCESNNNYTENSGNGYYGAYQFAPTTWWGLGYTGLPNQASPAVQDAAAKLLQRTAGWSSWPICSVVVGL